MARPWIIVLALALALLATSAQAASVRCATRARVEAMQRAWTLPPAERAGVERWLAPPPALPHWVEAASPFAVRVYYETPSQQPYAERILAAMALSYQRQVEEWGFWPPLTVEGEPYLVYVGDPGPGAAAYTSPYLANPVTPHEDAFTYIVVGPSLGDVALDTTVAHELNHACQAAMDMSEPSAFFESTATYVESLVFPAGEALSAQLLPVFQSQAHLPLEYDPPGPSDGYEYGAWLWLSFLAHRFGGDDPAWVADLWEGSMQAGPINEPDHRDVLDEWLALRGGQRAAVEEFGRWRFFVGDYGDDRHLPGATSWHGAEVPFAASFTTSQLPIVDQRPESARRPRPSGCNYVSLTAGEGDELPIRFRFEGDPALGWNVSVIDIAFDGSAGEQAMALDEARGELTLAPDDLHRAVLVVCQALGESFDLDEKVWPAGDYRYDIELDVPAPALDSIAPARLSPGVHGEPIVLSGDGFFPGVEVVVEGTGVALSDVERVSGQEIRARATVAPSAALGPRALVVTNPGGASASASLDIAAPSDVEQPAGEAAGCACRAAPAPSPRPLWWLLGSLLAFAARRRRLLFVAALLAGIALPSRAWAGPPSDGYVESTVHPIRVHYDNGADAAVAQEALGYAEEAWQKLFVEMGFSQPTTVDDGDVPIAGIWLYVDPAGANLAQAIGDNPGTPHTDCLTRIFIASTSPSSLMRSIVITEMAQATTLGLDCGEGFFAWKSSAVALTSLVAPEDPLFSDVMLPVYQSAPHAGLDCAFPGDADLLWYPYGGALFWRFVDEAYGAGDGALLVDVWDAAKQNGTVIATGTGLGELDVENEPDVLDAVAGVAPVSLDEVVSEFARWRYFVGARDDGAHFAEGSSWFGAEVAVDTQLTLADLPVAGAVPVEAVADYGTSYIEIDLADLPEEKGIAWTFAGDPAVAWGADVLLVRGDNSAEVHALDLAAGSGEIGGLSGFVRAVLAITNLSDGNHDADAPGCTARASYSYDLMLVDLAPPPQVHAVEPSSLLLGRSYDVFVTGADFEEGASVSFGEGIEVEAVTFVDPSTLAVALAVRSDAAPGPRDATVHNPSEESATLPGAVTLSAETAAPGDEQVGGCGCRTAAPARAPWALLLLAGALALALRRQRSTSSFASAQQRKPVE